MTRIRLTTLRRLHRLLVSSPPSFCSTKMTARATSTHSWIPSSSSGPKFYERSNSSPSSMTTAARFFTSSSGGGKGGDDDDADDTENIISDANEENELEEKLLFGSSDDDDDDDDDDNTKKDDMMFLGDDFGTTTSDGSDETVGPPPPAYKRDPTTGKVFTDQIEPEITADEKKLLSSLTEKETSAMLLDRMSATERKEDDDDPEAFQVRRQRLGERIREEQQALNILGRLPRTVNESGKSSATTSRALSPDEARALDTFVDQFRADSAADGGSSPRGHPGKVSSKLPVVGDFDDPRWQQQNEGRKPAFSGNTTTDPDMDVQWYKSAVTANTTGGGIGDGNTSSELDAILPSDFAPTKKANRKQAKAIPTSLLSHNNLPLLSRYLMPAGAIMNRAQTRLSAKDQRKVARMIKRARAMGLIPFLGQFKVEANGNLREPGLSLEKNTWWEDELERRGLTTPVQRKWKSLQETRNLSQGDEKLNE